MNQNKELDLVPTRIGPPRLDPYQRLLARFYESLFLLRSLGQTRGDHTPEPPSFDVNQTRRRRFLQNLSYVCDFKKGGHACTAIALEDNSACYRFWVASNKDVVKIVSFVEEILGILRSVESSSGLDQSHAKSNFVLHCANFAAERIGNEAKCLRRAAVRCIAELTKQRSEAGMIPLLIQ